MPLAEGAFVEYERGWPSRVVMLLWNVSRASHSPSTSAAYLRQVEAFILLELHIGRNFFR